MAINNITITNITFRAKENETFVDAYGASYVVLTLTPNQGYTISANDFSIIEPLPSYFTNIPAPTFVQDGMNILLTLHFASGAAMPEPGDNIDIPICLNGIAFSAAFTLNGTVEYLTGANITPQPSLTTYTAAGNEGETKQAFSRSVEANSGYRFLPDPQIIQTQGDTSSYSNASEIKEYWDQNQTQLRKVTFSTDYTFNNASVAGDYFKIYGETVPIGTVDQCISGYSINTGNIGENGGVRTMTVFGAENSTFSVTLSDGTTQSPIVTNQSMPASSSYSFNITFPPTTVDVTWTIEITGDICSTISQPNPFTISQLTNIAVTFTVIDDLGDFTITNDSDIVLPASTAFPSPQGFTKVIQIEYTGAGSPELTDQPDITDWSYQSGDPQAYGTLFSVTKTGATIDASDPNKFAVEVAGEIDDSGTQSFVSFINLSDIITATELPTIVTKGVTGETGTEVDSGGESITDGNGTISSKGIQWSEVADFSTILGANDEGTGTADFNSTITGLTTGNTYYVRAYAQNEAGVGYGQVIGFVSNITVPCSSTSSSGGTGITDLNINLDSGGGLVALLFDPIGVPDKMEIIHGGPDGTKVATSGFDNGTDGNSGPFDNVYGTEPSNTIPSSTNVANTDQFIGTNKGTAPTRETQFTNETGYIATMGSYQQIVWWQYTATDWQTAPNVTVRITGSTGTSWSFLRLCCPDGNCSVDIS